jgi:hypothetical protein
MKALARRVVVRHVAEPATQRLLLEKGDVDVARNLTRDQLDAIRGNSNIELQEAPKGSIVYLAMSQKNPNLAKPEVREALKWLVDYDGIERNIVKGRYVVHQAFLPTGFLGALEDRPYKFDIEKAKALLAKAGVPDGFSISMDVQNISPFTDIAQAIQASFAKAGVKVDLRGRAGHHQYRARNAVLLSWGPGYQDPHSNAETFAMNGQHRDCEVEDAGLAQQLGHPEMTKQTAAAVKEREEARADIAIQKEHQKVSPFIILFRDRGGGASERASGLSGPELRERPHATIGNSGPSRPLVGDRPPADVPGSGGDLAQFASSGRWRGSSVALTLRPPPRHHRASSYRPSPRGGGGPRTGGGVRARRTSLVQPPALAVFWIYRKVLAGISASRS